MNEMENKSLGTSWLMLAFSTLAFTVCFAAWTMNGVLITYFVDNGVFKFDPAQMGWLIGIPILSGSIMRLPIGVLTDKYGGRIVFGVLLLVSACFMYSMRLCNTYEQFMLASLGFGLAGTGFAVGIAYTSVWFPKRLQGTALGIFGAGNAGAALTSFGAPHVLKSLTHGGTYADGWKMLPVYYAVSLAVMGVIFLVFTKTKLPEGSAGKSLVQRLAPLKHVRVWRFGLYYFLVFGGFVALAQWLVPYYVNVYSTTLGLAGTLAAVNSLPSGVIRAFGGWLSDLKGARTVLYWVLGTCLIGSFLLIVPQMDISSKASGVMSIAGGEIIRADSSEIWVRGKKGIVRKIKLKKRGAAIVSEKEKNSDMIIWPRVEWWQEPVVKVGDVKGKKELLARGYSHIYFQANIWIFTFISFIVGSAMGIGKAAVYKYIPDYFPNDVGVVGGIVGVLGGLGGFICPVIFGNILKATGLWTSCWMFFFAVSALCLIWLHIVVTKINKEQAREVTSKVESGPLHISGN